MAETLRRAAAKAREQAALARSVAPHLIALYGDDCGTEQQALRDDAVADWLERQAEALDAFRDTSGPGREAVRQSHLTALAVARAWLGDDNECPVCQRPTTGGWCGPCIDLERLEDD